MNDLKNKSINVFNDQYKGKGMSSQRMYPNESLIQFIASNYFKLDFDKRKKVKILEVGSGSGANLWMLAKEGFDVYGLDLEMTRAISKSVSIPVISSGGCGRAGHFIDGFLIGGADAIAAGSFFSYKDQNQAQTRAQISNSGIPVRSQM